MTSEQSLIRLKDGNKRYAAGKPRHTSVSYELLNDLYVNGQFPYAVVVGCSDSRVSVELVFDAEPGDIFVVRTAGNVIGQIEMGSIEYAVTVLKTPLVVVLSHQKCGAVRAAVDGGDFSPAIQSIINEILPSVPTTDCEDKYTACEDQNVRTMISKLLSDPYINKAFTEGNVRLIGAKYSMETGMVSFFE